MEIDITVEKMPPGSHWKAGRKDNAGRWFPSVEYQYYGSFAVRSPTRAWPHSYVHHWYSNKYAKGLARYRPLEYMKLHGIDPKSEIGEILIARAVEQRLKGGSA